MSDGELQQYLFDLQGYLVVEDLLSADEVSICNELIDRKLPENAGVRFGSAPEGSGFLVWGQPFCHLLDHLRIIPILRFRLGDCFRLDRIYGMRMRKGMPRGELHADYGASSLTSENQQGEYRPFRDNEILNGFVVVAWNLTPGGPDHGGFCCIPGSHKCNYRVPSEIMEAPEAASCVTVPSAPAGSAILFTEALTHGTTAWRADHERRTLLYKYCVSQMAWTAGRVEAPRNAELTPRQRKLFLEPADPHRHFPSLFEEEGESENS